MKIRPQILADIMDNDKIEQDFDYEWCDDCGEWVHTNKTKDGSSCDGCGNIIPTLITEN